MPSSAYVCVGSDLGGCSKLPAASMKKSKAQTPPRPGIFAKLRHLISDRSSNVPEISLMILSQVQKDSRSAEAEFIRRAVDRDEAAIRSIIQANNRRLYRVAQHRARRRRSRGCVARGLSPRLFRPCGISRRFKPRHMANPNCARRSLAAATPPDRTPRRANRPIVRVGGADHSIPIVRTSTRGPRAFHGATRDLPAAGTRH